ncbi:hypothetical protein [Streptosporangium fragile]
MIRRLPDVQHPAPPAPGQDELAARRARRVAAERLRSDPRIRRLEQEHGVRFTTEELWAAEQHAQQASRHRHADAETCRLQLLVWCRLGPRGLQGFAEELDAMEAALAGTRDQDWEEPS